MRRIIVLRPEPGASETAARARQLGLDPMVIPMFKVEPLPWSVPDPAGFDAVLLTSANALRHGGEGLATLLNLPVYAVGKAAADAARSAGFAVAMIGADGVDALLAMVPSGLRLLHLCGEDRKPAAPTGHAIEQVMVYRAAPVGSPPLAAIEDGVVLVHSPRAGRRLAELVPTRGSIRIAALSPAAAAAVGSGWQAIEAAEEPTDEALLALAVRLCEKPRP